MARKDSSSKPPHGFNDIIGIVLIAAGLLLVVALFSFDRCDVCDCNPPNAHVHNLCGKLGAWLAKGFFFLFGAGAFVLPPLMLVLGLGYLFEFFSYIRRRLVWAIILFLSFLFLLGLYPAPLTTLTYNINALNAGGVFGIFAGSYLTSWLGKLGATILFAAVYFVSLIFLTNFQFGDWMRSFMPGAKKATAGSPEEEELERKARDLEKQARKLQEQVDKSKGRKVVEEEKEAGEERNPGGLGADMQPVPEPLIRDLSIPTAKPPTKKDKKAAENDPFKTDSELEEPVMVIPATEVAAATTADILGKKGGKKSEEPKVNEREAAAAVVVPEKDSETDAPVKADDDDDLPLPLPVAKPRLGAKKPKPISVASTPVIGNYRLPPIDFLQMPDMTAKPTESKEELMANAQLMRQTLAQFDIDVAVGDITKGPTITRYELHPAPGVRFERITALNNNIAAALKAERINMLAPVPGKSSVGVEVPNAVKTKVIMRDLLESEEWQKSKARIPLALGKDVYGQPIVADLAEMPHLLIAGSTGSGKSVCINSIVASLLYRFSPDQLRFVMIDPKVVELQQYNALPHLVVPVVTDPKKVILALRWVVNEMEKRYQIFARVGVRNIKSFNERLKDAPIPKAEPELPLTATKEKVEVGSDGFAVELDEEIVVPRDEDIVIPDKLSYIVVIIDELADLMLVAPKDVEMAIARITQMARAAGIHCIVATQRPSVDVITGVIKANIPARIAFQVAAKVDSRTILDAMGADKLLGKGDMMYLPPGSAKLIRAQGVLITDKEIQDCVDFIAKQGKPSYEMEIHEKLQKTPDSNYSDDEEGGIDEDEGLIEQCIEVIRTEQKASVSLMQRRLRLGYTRAARIMDELENRGIVGPSKGAEPRDILIDLDGEGADGAGQ